VGGGSEDDLVGANFAVVAVDGDVAEIFPLKPHVRADVTRQSEITKKLERNHNS